MNTKNLFDKAFSVVQSFSDKLTKYRVGKMHMINFICIYLCALFTLFVIGWLYQWLWLAKLDLMMLLEGIKPLSGAGFLALIKYITDVTAETKIMIDANNNGIPDDEEGDLVDKRDTVPEE